MVHDPFAHLAEPDEAQVEIEDQPVAEAPALSKEKVSVAVVPSEGKVVVTLKGASGYDAPWIVVHADDASDALAQLDDPNMVELIKKTSVMASGFQKTYKPGAAVAPARSSAPASNDRKPPVATEAPAGLTPTYCAHGERVFATGQKKDGSGMWRAWDCSQRVCDRDWINDRKK